MAEQWGMWSRWSKQFVFGIAESSKTEACKKLREKIGKDAFKWRFEARKIPVEKPQPKRRNVQMATIDNNSTKVITGVARLSYTHVFEPQPDDNGVDKYSTSILIPKTDTATIAKIEAATEAAKALAKTKGIKLVANCKVPLRDGDLERPDDEAYAGHYFLNATSRNKPGVAKPIGRENGRAKFAEITDSTEVYSGCYAKVSLNFYPYDAKGNRGIAAGLNNLVKVQDGDYLGGRSSLRDEFAEEDFDDIVDISDASFLD